MNVFVFKTYLEYVSPNDKVTVMRHILKELSDFAEHNILYQFTYDDLAPEQKAILHYSEDPIAQRLLTNLPARTTEELRALMVVTPAQIRLALIAAGIDLTAIDSAFDSIENVAERQKAKVLWEYATIVERNNPFVTAIGGLLGKTPEDIDAIFSLAKTLN